MTESSAEHSTELFLKTSEMVPNGINIPMHESWHIRSDIFAVTTFSGKLCILDGIPQNLFKTFENGSKLVHMVQNCL